MSWAAASGKQNGNGTLRGMRSEDDSQRAEMTFASALMTGFNDGVVHLEEEE